MTFNRLYGMTAKIGMEDLLREELVQLASKLQAIEGCKAVELYQDLKNPARFRFLEHWESGDAHRAAAEILGKASFAVIMETLAEPPSSDDLKVITLPQNSRV